MKSWFLSAVGVCLISVVAVGVVRAADALPFQYGFTKGDSWQYESVDIQLISLNENTLLDSRITTKFKFDVLEAGEDSTQIKVTYDAVSVEAKRGSKQQSHNSETGEGNSPELKTAVDDLIGRSVTFRILPDGTLTDLEGFDAVTASPFGKTFGGFTSDEVFLRSMQKLFPPLKELGDRLEIDESWTTSDRTVFDPTTTLVVELDHIVEGVKDQSATIGISGTAELKSTKDDFDGGIESQSITGDAVWNADKNCMSSYRLDSNITIFRDAPNGRILFAVHQETVTKLLAEN